MIPNDAEKNSLVEKDHTKRVIYIAKTKINNEQDKENGIKTKAKISLIVKQRPAEFLQKILVSQNF